MQGKLGGVQWIACQIRVMIDRISRDKMITLLDLYLAGEITNFEFENRLPNSKDISINEIWLFGVWRLYDDRFEHRAVGRNKISGERKQIFDHWISFLESDFEYIREKDDRPIFVKLYNVALEIITFGALGKTWMSRDINYEVWPYTVGQLKSKQGSRDPV